MASLFLGDMQKSEKLQEGNRDGFKDPFMSEDVKPCIFLLIDTGRKLLEAVIKRFWIC